MSAPTVAAVILIIVLVARTVAQGPLQPSAFTVLHSFTGPPNDGRNPVTGLIFDTAGNLYGTTRLGGTANGGTVFVVTPEGSEAVVYNFTGGPDGGDPGRLVLGADGNLYGTTYYDGGTSSGSHNIASGGSALFFNITGFFNTASGIGALASNKTGNFNTAVGYAADVSANDLTNATAIGNGAVVNASNKIRLGDTNITGHRRSGCFHIHLRRHQEGELPTCKRRRGAEKDRRV